MGKWIIALAAMAACLYVGYRLTAKNLNAPGLTYVSAGPDCIGALDNGHAAFPSDIADIEKTWGSPIPDELLRIGGIDWHGWARACRDGTEWRGAYWDRLYRYEGRLVLVDAEGAPAQIDPVGSHYLSHYDRRNGFVLYRIVPNNPPVTRHYLRFADPERLEQWRPEE